VPATLGIIFVLIYLVFRSAARPPIIMLSLPLALVGGLWLIWALGHAVSIASVIGFIALAGVAAEFGIIMLLYLRHAWERRLARSGGRGRGAGRGDPRRRGTCACARRP
jgi:Cu(I)/Ag(I) efflux system membrane protein CusA/SilA